MHICVDTQQHLIYVCIRARQRKIGNIREEIRNEREHDAGSPLLLFYSLLHLPQFSRDLLYLRALKNNWQDSAYASSKYRCQDSKVSR